MAGNFLFADGAFPVFTERQSTAEQLRQIRDYLFKLAEQLRYTTMNLGQENFNETELGTLTQTIREPLMTAMAQTAAESDRRARQLEAEVTALTGAVAATAGELERLAGETETQAETLTRALDRLETLERAEADKLTAQDLGQTGTVTVDGGRVTGVLTGVTVADSDLTGARIHGLNGVWELEDDGIYLTLEDRRRRIVTVEQEAEP